MTITYSHSGSLGDLIYSLPVVKHFGAGNFYVKLRSIEAVAAKYGYHQRDVSPFHLRKMTETEFYLLEPLLEAQPYITKVIPTDNFDFEATYDLDKFRSVLFRTFNGNYLEAYFKTFGIPYTVDDLIAPWLVAEPKAIAPIVVTRTFRYRNPVSEAKWKEFAALPGFNENTVFVGLADEHVDFQQMTGSKVPYYGCKDFLEMARVIAGCKTFIGNQTFAYGLAQGLGKQTFLECIPDRDLLHNECFFPRPDCHYF